MPQHDKIFCIPCDHARYCVNLIFCGDHGIIELKCGHSREISKRFYRYLNIYTTKAVKRVRRLT